MEGMAPFDSSQFPPMSPDVHIDAFLASALYTLPVHTPLIPHVHVPVHISLTITSPGFRCARADCPLSSALRVDRMDVAEYLVSQGADLGECLMRLAGCTDRRLARMLGVRLGNGFRYRLDFFTLAWSAYD